MGDSQQKTTEQDNAYAHEMFVRMESTMIVFG